jgi:hypothetical protein
MSCKLRTRVEPNFGLNPGGFRPMYICMKRSLLLLFAALVITCTSGCGHKQEASDQASNQNTDIPAQPGGETPTAGAPEAPGPQPVPIPEPVASETKPGEGGEAASADTTALTIQLRRWMMNTRSGVPKSFEDWVAKSKIQVPPPPAGKKYVIRSGWVALVDK